jgi:FKBP-type peptidyl-prolyl cis-trans isomerase
MALTALLSSACASGTASSTISSAASVESDQLSVTDSRVGTGQVARTHQCLYVHYVGLLADGRTFESTRAPLPNGRVAAPVAFELGTGAVMPGWEKGLNEMRVGGMRRLWIPYRLAYGASGQPPTIPPRTDLIFDIELMAVAEPLPSSSNAMRAEGAKQCPDWRIVSRVK